MILALSLHLNPPHDRAFFETYGNPIKATP